ncbi:hypothetical protein AB7M63_004653 [Bradyrhizobium japonicum]|nr:hypothetical protein [Bradyrhizobium japonicum]
MAAPVVRAIGQDDALDAGRAHLAKRDLLRPHALSKRRRGYLANYRFLVVVRNGAGAAAHRGCGKAKARQFTLLGFSIAVRSHDQFNGAIGVARQVASRLSYEWLADTTCQAAGLSSHLKRATPRTVQEARANARAAELAPVIKALQKSGATSLGALAKKLNETRVPTPTGRGGWSYTQVWRLLERLRQISHEI